MEPVCVRVGDKKNIHAIAAVRASMKMNVSCEEWDTAVRQANSEWKCVKFEITVCVWGFLCELHIAS